MDIPTSGLYYAESTKHHNISETSKLFEGNSNKGLEYKDPMLQSSFEEHDFDDEDSLFFSGSDDDEESLSEATPRIQSKLLTNLSINPSSITDSFSRNSGLSPAVNKQIAGKEEDSDPLYDISRLGMYFFPQVTLLKTSQAGRRTKTAQARRQMRHLRLHPSDYHEAVKSMRRELLPSSAPMDADLYGVHLPFGEDIAISVELLEMSRSDEDGYYRRVGMAPMVSGLGELFQEQANAFGKFSNRELNSSISTYRSSLSGDLTCYSRSNSRSELEDGEIREDPPLSSHRNQKTIRRSSTNGSKELNEASGEYESKNRNNRPAVVSSENRIPIVPKLALDRIGCSGVPVKLSPSAPPTITPQYHHLQHPLTPSSLSDTSTQLRVKNNHMISPRAPPGKQTQRKYTPRTTRSSSPHTLQGATTTTGSSTIDTKTNYSESVSLDIKQEETAIQTTKEDKATSLVDGTVTTGAVTASPKKKDITYVLGRFLEFTRECT